jgi:predicted MFS family arabinose efflux permease
MKFIDKNKTTIFLLSILGVLATDSFAPLIQKIGQSYPGVSEPLVKQLITLPSTISMIVGLIAGQLVRFFSKRGIIITGLVLFTILACMWHCGAFWAPGLAW